MKELILFLQNHQMLSIALIIILILLFIVEWFRTKLNARRISPRETTHMMNHEDAIIVDIRNADAFHNGHIIGAISLPFPDLEKQYKKLEKNIKKPIIIVCATGLESPRAAQFLSKHGYHTLIQAGGIRAWIEADMPLVKN
ncbi:MAG: rhodanese-like domain-containing protein [Gammaproteobacteria bacterium]|nr:rhodanese-like domain-containing protein [Gammaproteobacteria bacterium]